MKAPIKVPPGKVAWIFLLVLVLLVAALATVSEWIQDWLWMTQVGYAVVFWRILSVQFVSAGLAALITFAYIGVNLRLALAIIFRLRGHAAGGNVVVYTRRGIRLPAGWSKLGALVIAVVVSLAFALAFYIRWDPFLRFHWGAPSGRPIRFLEKTSVFTSSDSLSMNFFATAWRA